MILKTGYLINKRPSSILDNQIHTHYSYQAIDSCYTMPLSLWLLCAQVTFYNIQIRSTYFPSVIMYTERILVFFAYKQNNSSFHANVSFLNHNHLLTRSSLPYMRTLLRLIWMKIWNTFLHGHTSKLQLQILHILEG